MKKKSQWIDLNLLRDFEAEGTDAHRLCTIEDGWVKQKGHSLRERHDNPERRRPKPEARFGQHSEQDRAENDDRIGQDLRQTDRPNNRPGLPARLETEPKPDPAKCSNPKEDVH